MAIRKAIIKGGEVVNVVLVNPDDKWTPPKGHKVIEHETASVGWLYEDGKLIPPHDEVPVHPDDRPEYVKARQHAFTVAESSGDLPATVRDNIDEIWKALGALQDQGISLPSEAERIIAVRVGIKEENPKN